MLYQLGPYNTKPDLTVQGKQIRDFVQTNYKYEKVKTFVSRYKFLEHESILILRCAILAGYWTSYYGFGWTKEQEIDFWEFVLTKNTDSGIIFLTLAESYRGNGIKSLQEVYPLYIEAIQRDPQHYYSLSETDVEELKKYPAYKFQILEIELSLYENMWSKSEWLEEHSQLIKDCNGDKEMEEVIHRKVEKILSGT
ncbi:hypothetical protein QNI16_33585 [Cytophagaceae bacterium YF14B1]|uniref:Uncharacterized protein n=1 Tax=Xanthocytophaga flava TaxID=3048013 RepID=A0AAE3QYB0_9BACT|nr:hypothetical protein [Xanthocytophaga flavus]MDJ1485471.1 hypothetical protein [Xanthocytophaga flavus]